MAEGSTDWEKRYGFVIVVVGLGALLIALAVAASRWNAAADVTAVVSAFGSVLGTLVGAYFGVQVGSTGQKEALMEATRARRETTLLALHVPKEAQGDARKDLLGMSGGARS